MSAVCVPSGVAKNLITGFVAEIISDEFTLIFFLSKSCLLKILLVVRLSHIFPTATCPVEFALSLFLKCKVPPGEFEQLGKNFRTNSSFSSSFSHVPP